MLTLFPGAADVSKGFSVINCNLWEEGAALLKFCKETLASANRQTAFCVTFSI